MEYNKTIFISQLSLEKQKVIKKKTTQSWD
ncbi:hypothetical protein ABMB67_001645 [Halalkalibacter oceani]